MLTSADSRLKHATRLWSLFFFLATYSGLAFALQSAYCALGILADSSIFIVSTICSEQFLLYTTTRFLHPTLAASLIVPGRTVWATACSVASGLMIRLAFGRLLEASSIKRMALRLHFARFKIHKNHVAALRAPVQSKLHPGLLHWVLFYGRLGVTIPCVLGFSMLAETLFWGIHNQTYGVLRECQPFWKPNLTVVPLFTDVVAQSSVGPPSGSMPSSSDGARQSPSSMGGPLPEGAQGEFYAPSSRTYERQHYGSFSSSL